MKEVQRKKSQVIWLGFFAAAADDYWMYVLTGIMIILVHTPFDFILPQTAVQNQLLHTAGRSRSGKSRALHTILLFSASCFWLKSKGR